MSGHTAQGRSWLCLSSLNLRTPLSKNNLPRSWSLGFFRTLHGVCYPLASPCVALFSFFLCTHPKTHFPISNWHSLLHNVSNWLIRYQRLSSLCKCSLNNSYRAVREREKRHFRNQLTRPLTMNNWSELIKICRDYPSPPQQIKHHTCVCCLFTYSPLSLLPLTQTCFN